MAILFSDEIYKAICSELSQASSSVQIITAYGKIDALKLLMKNIPPAVSKKRLLVRFRLDDLIKGSTDYEIIDYCRELGWDVFIRFDLHAKTYVIDNKRGIIGSANATNSGLAINQHPNYEIATLVEIEENDTKKIDSLFNEAIKVDDTIISELKSAYDNAKNKANEKSEGESFQWPKSISSRFNPSVGTLFSYEFPQETEFIPNQFVQFLEMSFSTKEEYKATFRWCKAYLWLLKALNDNDGTLYFGELSALLHNCLVSDPKPYRRDVKEMLSNLLSIITFLDMDEVIIDRPNYSQRIRLSGV